MELVQLLKVLGDPTRFRMIELLLERKHCVRSLARAMNISESAVSQHLKMMKEASLVYSEKFGYHTHYFIQQDAMNYLVQQFTFMQIQSLNLDRNTKNCQCDVRKEK